MWISAGALARAAIAGLLLFPPACVDSSRSSSSVTAPSPTPMPPAATAHTLVIRVRARGSEAPIDRALVRHKLDGYYTNAAGEARLTVASGEETTIAVSAADFGEMQASGTLHGDEQWTFYLEADQS